MKERPNALATRRTAARASLADVMLRAVEDPPAAVAHRDVNYLRALFNAHDWIEQEIFREGRHYTRRELEEMAAGG